MFTSEFLALFLLILSIRPALAQSLYICTIVNWNRNFALAISSQNIDNVKCSINKLRTSRTNLWRNSPKQIENENSTWIYICSIYYIQLKFYLDLARTHHEVAGLGDDTRNDALCGIFIILSHIPRSATSQSYCTLYPILQWAMIAMLSCEWMNELIMKTFCSIFCEADLILVFPPWYHVEQAYSKCSLWDKLMNFDIDID